MSCIGMSTRRSIVMLAAGLWLGLTGMAGADVAARLPLQAACFAGSLPAARPDEAVPRRLEKRVSMRLPDAGDEQGLPVDAARRGAIRRVLLPAGSKKLVALTLDFCEQSFEVAGYDGGVIDVLRRERVQATLFIGGKWMLSHDQRTQQLMSDPLFELGTHGWVHRNVRGLTGAALKGEIVAPTGAYRTMRTALAGAQCAAPHGQAVAAIPAQVSLTRFAFGACNADSMRVANDAGLQIIQWDVSTGDASPTTSAREIVATIVRQTRPGSIILAHANGRGFNTAAALPVAIKELRARGFEFVTVSRLLQAGTPVIVDSCYDAKPGDTDKYDRFFARPVKAP